MFRALQCPSSGARQTAVAASGFPMNMEVEVQTDHGRDELLMMGIIMPITRSPSNCRCNLWFSDECGGGSANRPRQRRAPDDGHYYAHHQEPVKLPLQPLVFL